MNCILCDSKTDLFFTYSKRKGQKYYRCRHCGSVMLHPDFYISPDDEKNRYLTHNNDVNDPGYQQFVSPIVNSVQKDFEPTDHGLDFGSGTGPVITKMLRDKGYQLTTWDPFFNPDDKALETTYDYIVCCEVIEHFHHPGNEFERLRSLLKNGGILYLKTELYTEETSFENWRYKDDETHTIFYHPMAFKWIKQEFGFSKLYIYKDFITLKK